jgi:hypothetical protein
MKQKKKRIYQIREECYLYKLWKFYIILVNHKRHVDYRKYNWKQVSYLDGAVM